MDLHLTSRGACCFGFLKPTHYHCCASCDGERLPITIVDPSYIVWSTILLKFALLTGCGYSEAEMQLERDRAAELTEALRQCGERISDSQQAKDAGVSSK